MEFLFPLELNLFEHIESSSYFMISEDSYMSLFGRFPFWVPTRFLEAFCPRYGPVRTIKLFFSEIFQELETQRLGILLEGRVSIVLGKKISF